MTPLLDGVVINNRVDWKHIIAPAQQPVMEDGFPGVAQRFIRQGTRKPDDLVLEGFLEGTGASVGAAITSLITANRALLAKRNDGLEHTVKIHNATWSSLVVADVANTTRVIAVLATEGYKVTRGVRIAFRQTSDTFEVEAEE